MSFRIIDKVPGIRIIYDVSTISAAAGIRNALGRLTNNDREKLLIQMGPATANCSDVTIHILPTKTEVRVEDAKDKPKQLKIFCPEKLPRETSEALADYLLKSYDVI